MNDPENESMQRPKETTLNRREALRNSGAIGASLIGFPSALASECSVGVGIEEIHMKSSRLDELRKFYEEVIELPVTFKQDTLTVKAGATRLKFTPSDSQADAPFYHFAFNIPENKIESARRWQRERTRLLCRGSKEVIHFSGINAHSIYFNDPAGNIVEYIARHDLENSARGEFGPEQILYASEIGIVVDDVVQTQRQIKETLGLKGFPGSYRSSSFSPVGDAHALLILVKRNRMWFPNKKQAACVHPVEATIRGTRSNRLHNAELEYQINLASRFE